MSRPLNSSCSASWSQEENSSRLSSWSGNCSIPEWQIQILNRAGWRLEVGVKPLPLGSIALLRFQRFLSLQVFLDLNHDCLAWLINWRRDLRRSWCSRLSKHRRIHWTHRSCSTWDLRPHFGLVISILSFEVQWSLWRRREVSRLDWKIDNLISLSILVLFGYLKFIFHLLFC